MTPVEQAKELLGDAFRNDLEAHLITGYVLNTPNAFLMGKPVPFGASIIDPWETWLPTDCDSWFCWAAIGNLGDLFYMIPHRLPFIGWFRQNRGWRETHWVSFAGFESALARLGKL